MASSRTPSPWEIAKPILLKDYENGLYPDKMPVRQVWASKAVFKNVAYDQFYNNFGYMKKAAKKKINKAAWDAARPILLKDYENGLYPDSMPVKQVWESKTVFQSVDYDQFYANFNYMKRTTKKKKREPLLTKPGIVMTSQSILLQKIQKDIGTVRTPKNY